MLLIRLDCSIVRAAKVGEISAVCFLSDIMELDGNRLKANGANNKAAGKKKMHLNDSTAEFMSQILKIICRLQFLCRYLFSFFTFTAQKDVCILLRRGSCS